MASLDRLGPIGIVEPSAIHKQVNRDSKSVIGENHEVVITGKPYRSSVLISRNCPVRREGASALLPTFSLLQCLARGLMLDLAKTIGLLKQEREQAARSLDQLDTALKVLSGLGSIRGNSRGRRTAIGKRRTMSAAARKRIAAAQRARWAKWKAAQKKK